MFQGLAECLFHGKISTNMSLYFMNFNQHSFSKSFSKLRKKTWCDVKSSFRRQKESSSSGDLGIVSIADCIFLDSGLREVSGFLWFLPFRSWNFWPSAETETLHGGQPALPSASLTRALAHHPWTLLATWMSIWSLSWGTQCLLIHHHYTLVL